MAELLKPKNRPIFGSNGRQDPIAAAGFPGAGTLHPEDIPDGVHSMALLHRCL
jgi:hypothetical protein